MTSEADKRQAAQGWKLLDRMVSAPDKGPGHRRDPVTGLVLYSSEWLSDRRDRHNFLRVVDDDFDPYRAERTDTVN